MMVPLVPRGPADGSRVIGWLRPGAQGWDRRGYAYFGLAGAGSLPLVTPAQPDLAASARS